MKREPGNEPPKSTTGTAGGLSENGLTRVRKQMVEFDDLPSEVRAALYSADQPSDQMIDVVCAMHRGGHSIADMLRVISVSNAKSG